MALSYSTKLRRDAAFHDLCHGLPDDRFGAGGAGGAHRNALIAL